MDLCPACGLVAPNKAQRCEGCGAEWSQPRPRVAREADDPWCAAVQVELQCRTCQRLSPLNHLDLDGTARCSHCGAEQAFPPEAWREALELAASVGDLGGNHPEGRVQDPGFSIADFNPHRSIGNRAQSHQATLSGAVPGDGVRVDRTLKLKIAPGHPVCPRCGVATRLSLSGDQVSAHCPRCGASRSSRNPTLPGGAELAELCPGLVGVIDASSSVDAARASTLSVTRSTPAGLSCPGCGAPLPLPRAGNVVTCPFCQLSSRLPDAVAASIPAQPVWWWLVYQGPSELRRQLVRDPALWEALPLEEDRVVSDAPTREASAPVKALRWAIIFSYGSAALILTGLILAIGLMKARQWPPW